MNKKHASALLIGLLFFAGIPFNGLARTASEKSVWSDTPPAVDGSSEDWGGAAMTTYKKAKVDYAFKNDGTNLYVLFIFKDPKRLSTLNATGLTVWLNPEGKKSKDYGIRFAKKKVTPDYYIAYLEKQGNVLSEEDKTKIKAAPAYYFNQAVAVNKKGEPLPAASESGTEGEAFFRSKTQGEEMVYEISIPLKKEAENSQGLGAGPGGTIKIGFEWGGVTEEMKASGRRGAGTNLAAADRARDGQVANPTGMGRGGAPRTASTPPKYSFWADLELAAGK